MLTVEIYFNDLTKEAQKNLLGELDTTEAEENFDTCPLAISDREEGA